MSALRAVLTDSGVVNIRTVGGRYTGGGMGDDLGHLGREIRRSLAGVESGDSGRGPETHC